MQRILLLLFLFTYYYPAISQVRPFRFAFLSDTHIGSPDGKAEEDLKRTVNDINAMNDIDFVVLTGDITELGTDEELPRAKKLFDSLKVKYYIIPGNHDDGWSESGGMSFISTFGSDRFVFDHNGIRFIGCASGPYVRMSDGHIPRDAITWMKSILDTTAATMPVIFLNHYPMDIQMDNWYEVTDMFRKRNTILFLCGHGHTNKVLNFEDIPGIMGRSNLRAKQTEGGYNLVDVRSDSILFTERKPVSGEIKKWAGVKIEQHNYDVTKKFTRPDYSINDKYPQVKAKWTYSSAANVISTPALINDLSVFGNQQGIVTALSLKNGKEKWTFTTGGSIYSSPAVYQNLPTGQAGKIVLGSANGYVYCLNDKGKEMWKLKTGAAVLGSPAIENKIVYIGGSDHTFRAIDLQTGKELWNFNGLNGPVVSTPVIYKNDIIFGAWDTYLYSLNKNTGALNWKWSNGSSVKNYSPAACIPVIKDDIVYVVAPDRYLTAIDALTGQTLWRTNESTVRESMGISKNGKFIYGKTMNDTLAVFNTGRQLEKPAWKLNVGYGYEHTPSTLIEKDGNVFFGTRNGVVYAINVAQKKIAWAYKIDNSMVNTVNVIDKKNIIVSTMDGKVTLLQIQ
ncbi:MAG TPA: PQQ-binding-like beta-propeller repeat protein [Chitinophagaceae bacterium]|nr:PQQ-binding-like beta-propeller repeat protein [Chitinophagaceae bacterium]